MRHGIEKEFNSKVHLARISNLLERSIKDFPREGLNSKKRKN